jgi:hypothetical protein
MATAFKTSGSVEITSEVVADLGCALRNSFSVVITTEPVDICELAVGGPDGLGVVLGCAAKAVTPPGEALLAGLQLAADGQAAAIGSPMTKVKTRLYDGFIRVLGWWGYRLLDKRRVDVSPATGREAIPKAIDG